MASLKFHGFAHTGSYQGEHVPSRVHKGQVVEVSDEGSAYLLQNFGDAFSKMGPEPGTKAEAKVEPKPKTKAEAKAKAEVDAAQSREG